ncbi:MAG: PQQ-like beta-propeller repeat protein [candidate division Zixibacteria bacterium]|nr:PQQ-like beta-propeller repeat protein [candidate division Zixibacteria bacterium]
MKINIFKKTLVIPVLLLLSCASSLKFPQVDFREKESDWRSFRGSSYYSGSKEYELTLPLKLIWKEKIGASYSTPLVVDKMVIIGSLDSKIAFLNFNSGENLGSYSLSYPLSITPCVEDSILYYSGKKGNTVFFALNLKTETPIWEKELQDISSSPVVYKDKLLVGTEKGELLCLDKENGKQLWRYKTDGLICSTPVFNEENLYFGSADRNIYCLESDSGNLIWRYTTNGAIYASPCMDDKALYTGSLDGNFYVLELSTGKLLWKFKTEGSIRSSAVLNEEMVFFGSNDGIFYALSTKNGELIWSFKTDGPVLSSPLLAGDKIFFGSLDGNFYGLRVADGEMVFKYKTGGMIYASPSFSRGRILIASTDKYIYSFGSK